MDGHLLCCCCALDLLGQQRLEAALADRGLSLEVHTLPVHRYFADGTCACSHRLLSRALDRVKAMVIMGGIEGHGIADAAVADAAERGLPVVTLVRPGIQLARSWTDRGAVPCAPDPALVAELLAERLRLATISPDPTDSATA
jgi:hypothetical protein